MSELPPPEELDSDDADVPVRPPDDPLPPPRPPERPEPEPAPES